MCVSLTVYGFLHALQSCIGSVHIQSEVVELFLAQLTVPGLHFQHLTVQDLRTNPYWHIEEMFGARYPIRDHRFNQTIHDLIAAVVNQKYEAVSPVNLQCSL